jgi:PAS domain S-box-containing protein
MDDSEQSRLNSILDSIADGVFTVDAQWRITTFNRAAEFITGTSRKEAIGRNCWEVFHADICERNCLLKKTLKTNRQSINKTVHIVNNDGKTIPISISTAILKDNNGTVIGGVETFRDLSEIEELRKEVSGRFRHGDILTRDHRLLDLLSTLPVIAKSDSPVLILGESGTGKELFAKALHTSSDRAKEPFIAVNCGALPENLLESELFGYRKGAFTDAKTNKPGRFDRAKRGTIFLDEIGDLPKSVQVKLLRVLQERVYEPLGATDSIATEARVIAATNRDLERMVASGDFRQDLYYRINVVPVTLPPLREREGDIPLLVEHFILHYNLLFNKSIERIDSDAMSYLLEYHYPGNVRELENVLQHAFVLCQGSVILKKHLPEILFRKKDKESDTSSVPSTVEMFDKQQVEAALIRNKYHRLKTARELGVHVATLWRKMKRYGIEG